jgi:hypothetical protein
MGMASRMALQLLSVIELKMLSGMLTEMILELEIALAMQSESTLFGHVCFEEIHVE